MISSLANKAEGFPRQDDDVVVRIPKFLGCTPKLPLSPAIAIRSRSFSLVMRHLSPGGIPAPSSTLLQFLRYQADNVCLFTPNLIYPAGNLHLEQRRRRIQCENPPCKLLLRRFSTPTQREATVEASLLNLDFLSKAGSLRFPKLAPTSRRSIVTRHWSQDGMHTIRQASSDSRSLLARLWNFRQKRERTSSRALDRPVPFLSDSSGTSLGRSKATNEMKLRCTELDENGNVTLVNSEFKKSELIAKVY